MNGIRLDQARAIITAAFQHGAQLKLAPLTVAVLDAGGHLIALERQDGSGILRPQIAVAKAWGVLGMGLPVRGLMERAEAAPAFFTALTTLAGGRMVPVRGGVPVLGEGDVRLGSVGVTGDTSVNDEACAVAGIRSAGLRPWLE
ncbi:MAG: heme-binding protein [Actinobacteria bacterium]|nr:heme-binding protein [Actinomycetota bacterium]